MIMRGLLMALATASAFGQAAVERPGGVIDLPTSKQIVGAAPGGPQRLSSLPMTMAVSPASGNTPAGRWVVTVNAGYGSQESGYKQALAVLDTRTGKVVEYPDARTPVESKQVLYSGLAFSADGTKLYGSLASLTDPEGKTGADTGSGVQVYGFRDGVVTRERVLKIPLQKLTAGRRTLLAVPGGDGTLGMPYPAAIAVVGPTHHGEAVMNGARRNRVAENGCWWRTTCRMMWW